jgi:hypothetical protein
MTEDSARLPSASAVGADYVHPDHLRKEGWTMALYVAICLIAALTALETVRAVPGDILGLIWGTTVGLALAHLFAFRIAGRLVHYGELPKADRIVSMVQMASAAAVAVVVSVPVPGPDGQRAQLGALHLRRHHRCGRLLGRPRRRTQPNPCRAVRPRSPRHCCHDRRSETRAGGSLGVGSGLICLINR